MTNEFPVEHFCSVHGAGWKYTFVQRVGWAWLVKVLWWRCWNNKRAGPRWGWGEGWELVFRTLQQEGFVAEKLRVLSAKSHAKGWLDSNVSVLFVTSAI